jgi:hypothetical protein
MHLDEKKKTMHLAWTIAAAFFLSNLAFLISMFFIPTLGEDGKPLIHPVSATLGEIQTAMLILGCVAMGIKLTEDKKTIPSIGFTMMSIAQGIIFIIYTISLSSHEALDEVFRIYTSSMYLLIPSMILIAFYSDFPKWLNFMGVAACIPMMIENIGFAISGHLSQWMMYLDGISQMLFAITAFFWGLRTIRNAKREIKSNDLTPKRQ